MSLHIQNKFYRCNCDVIKGDKMYQLVQPQKRMYVKDYITTAFFQLLEKKAFDKITVSEIITRAGVSRMGFYRNFNSKESIIENFILEKFKETIDEITASRKLNFRIENIMITTLVNFKKFACYIKLFLDKNLDALLYRCYHKAYYSLYSSEKDSAIRDYSNEMFIAELFNLEMCWVRKGMKESPEQLARIYSLILKLRCNAI